MGGECPDFTWFSVSKAHTHVQSCSRKGEAAGVPHLGSVSIPLPTLASYVTSPLELLKASSGAGWAKDFQRSTETTLILCLSGRLSRNVLLIMSGNLVLALLYFFKWNTASEFYNKAWLRANQFQQHHSRMVFALSIPIHFCTKVATY